MSFIYVILLIIILAVIFKDVIFKVIKGKSSNFYNSEKIKIQEYNIRDSKSRDLFIDVLDTDIKILTDSTLDHVYIQTNYLVDKFFYDISHDQKHIRIVRNSRDNFKAVGNCGRVLVKIPKDESTYLKNIDIKVKNGDIEIYDLNIEDLSLESHNGSLKIDTISCKHMSIMKSQGDVNLSYGTLNNLYMKMKNGDGDFIDVYGKDIEVDVSNGDFIFVNEDEDYKIDRLNVNVSNGKEKLKVNH